MGFGVGSDLVNVVDPMVNAAFTSGQNVLLRASLPASQHDGTDPVDYDAYGDWMATLADRYKGQAPGGKSPVMELPNELNHLAGSVYALIAADAYPKVKAVDPNIMVIGASANVYAAGWDDWLDDVYAGGFAANSDGLSFHNYDPITDSTKWNAMQAIRTAYGDNGMLWLTEFGATTCPIVTGSTLGCQTLQGQQDRIVSVLRSLVARGVTHAFVYTDEDAYTRKGVDDFEAYFGCYNNDGSGNVTGPKPAAYGIKDQYKPVIATGTLARTDLLGQTSGTALGTGGFTTSSFTPPSNSLLVVSVVGMTASGASLNALTNLTVSGGGWTYERRVARDTSRTSFDIGVQIFTAPVTTGASMTLSLGSSAVNMNLLAVSAVAYTNYNTAHPVGVTASGQALSGADGAQSITLLAPPASTSQVFAAMMIDKESVGSTPGAGFTQIHTTQAGSAGGVQSQARGNSTSTTVDWVDTHTGAGTIFGYVAAALEIKAAS